MAAHLLACKLPMRMRFRKRFGSWWISCATGSDREPRSRSLQTETLPRARLAHSPCPFRCPSATCDGPEEEVLMVPLINFIVYVIQLYIWVIIASAILSWLIAFNVVNTSNRFVYSVADMLYRLTEPALRPIRSFIPNLGGIDISPVILILILLFIINVVLLGWIAPAFQPTPTF
jgi:YggT family protein